MFFDEIATFLGLAIRTSALPRLIRLRRSAVTSGGPPCYLCKFERATRLRQVGTFHSHESKLMS